MTRKTRWHKLIVALGVLALLASACRGEGEEDVTLDEAQEDLTEDAEEADPTDEAEEPTDEPTDAEGTDEPTDAEGTDEPTDAEGTEPTGDVAFDVGVTEEACPEAVNPDNGCIYLGTISDLTAGPFAALAVPITDAQAAFWNRVNEEGGIGGFDINVSEFVRDNLYDPEVHSQEYQAIQEDVLALAQTLGSPTTAAIIDDLNADGVIGAPASWTSLWAFEDAILESGINYCLEAMNQVDYTVMNVDGVESIMAVGYPGDYGGDAAFGAQVAADANGLEFTNIETVPGPDNQTGAIEAIVSGQPSVVVVTTGPADAGAIVGNAAARGYTGQFMFTGPSWNQGLLGSAAGAAIQAQVLISGYWQPFDADTPGHEAMREAIGDVEPNEGYTSGWAWSYPLLAVLEQAAANGDLTREGVLAAVTEVSSTDYEGMLPEGAGNFGGDPNENVVRESVIFTPDPEAPTGATLLEDFFVGPTAEAYEFTGACFTTTG